jgi:hypothetical protein
MSSFDLNIENYTVEELQQYFKLKKNYTIKEVNDREYTLRNQLIHHDNIDKKYKTDLIDFLINAKQILVKNIEKKTPTLIPKNYKLDEPEYLVEPSITQREESIIQRPVKDYVYTQNTEFLPGKLNPLNNRTITKNVTIDTRFRNDYYYTKNNEFVITLPFKLSKVVSMELKQIEIPTNFYNISCSLGNHYLNISAVSVLDGLMTKGSKVVIVPDGYYTTENLVKIINQILCPIDDSGNIKNPYELFSGIEVKIDKTTQRVVICPRGDFYFINIILDFTKDINGNLDNKELYTKMGWVLGYTQPFYENSSFHTGDIIIEKVPSRYFYLGVDEFNNNTNNSFISVFNGSIFNSNVIARISIKGTSSFYSESIENEISFLSMEKSFFGPVEIQKLKISLYDNYGRILDTNNYNYSFCLSFKMLYDL